MNATIELMRHGETGQRSWRGQLDDALLDVGWAQMRAAVQGARWDLIVSSNLQRCARFAQELADQLAVPLHIDPRWAEYHFGDWQGVPIEHLAEQDADALGRFWADPLRYPPPGSEGLTQFRDRLVAALEDALANAAPGARVLVITHGGVIRLLRCLSEDRPLAHMAQIEVPHACRHLLVWPERAAA